MMVVKLPGTYTGGQILEAFKRACSFQDGESQYSGGNSRTEYQYEPGSVKQTIRRGGAVLVRSFSELSERRKIMLFFLGPVVEKPQERNCAELLPVCANEKYSEVNVRALYEYFGAFDTLEYGYTEPGCPYFNRTLFEKLIGNFYKELQLLPVSA